LQNFKVRVLSSFVNIIAVIVMIIIGNQYDNVSGEYNGFNTEKILLFEVRQ
jgi:hypothetical protein